MLNNVGLSSHQVFHSRLFVHFYSPIRSLAFELSTSSKLSSCFAHFISIVKFFRTSFTSTTVCIVFHFCKGSTTIHYILCIKQKRFVLDFLFSKLPFVLTYFIKALVFSCSLLVLVCFEFVFSFGKIMISNLLTLLLVIFPTYPSLHDIRCC